MLFRKIVSNLPFSPALVGQLGFYANRLRKEEVTRRIGLIFVALALIVQSFAVFSPPESANAANGNNVIYGGISSKDELLKIYDRNKDSAGHKDIQEIYKEFGITRSDIKNAKTTTFNSKDFDSKLLSVGRSKSVSHQHTAIKVNDTSTTVYQGKLHAFDTYDWSKKHGTNYKAVVGKRSADGKWFAIMFACGNPVYLSHPPAPKPKPGAACTSLKVVSLSRTDYRLEAKADVDNGASISKYIYTVKDKSDKIVMTKTDTTSKTFSSVTNNFESAGTYKASVVVKTSEGNKSGTKCQDRFTVSPEAPKPNAECKNLRLTALSRTNFRLDGAASTSNGATVSRYTYVIKDASGVIVATKTVDTADLNTSSTYNFTKDGTYSVTLTIATSVGNKSSTDCVKSLTVTPQPRCALNPDFEESSPECKPCEDDETVWYKDENCASDFELTKTVRNATQLISNANDQTAHPGDRLEYHLSVKNKGNETGNFTMSDNISDVLEYADLIDDGGATLADSTVAVEEAQTLTWPSIELAPGQVVEKIITVQIKQTIPATPQSPGNLTSYDCQLMNNFQGQQTNVLVDCPTPKIVEHVVDQLPETGPTENMLFAGIVFAVVTFFYARSRQLKKEVRLIRRDINTGAI